MNLSGVLPCARTSVPHLFRVFQFDPSRSEERRCFHTIPALIQFEGKVRHLNWFLMMTYPSFSSCVRNNHSPWKYFLCANPSCFRSYYSSYGVRLCLSEFIPRLYESREVCMWMLKKVRRIFCCLNFFSSFFNKNGCWCFCRKCSHDCEWFPHE